MPLTAAQGMWLQAGTQAAQGAVGMGVQRLGVNYDHRKQREQQQKLMDMQIEGEARLMDIQSQKQLEMWEKTGYGAQKDQMKRAGINPALLYGMSGGGGQTVGGSMPGVGGGQASDPNTRGMGISRMELGNLALLQAQKENIEADTANKLQDAKKTWQETHELEMRNLITEITQAVRPDGSNAEGNIHETAAVKAKLQELLGDGIRNNLMEKDIAVGQAQIEKMAADIAQKAQEIIIQQGHLDVAKLLAEFNTDWGNILGKEAINAVGGIIQLMGLKTILGGSGHKAVEGFRRKSY